MADLKPCPFCGGEGRMSPPTCKVTDDYNPADRLYPVVQCRSCGARTVGDNEDYRGDTAVDSWNRREPVPHSPEGEDAEYVVFEWQEDGNPGAGGVVHAITEAGALIDYGEMSTMPRDGAEALAERLREKYKGSRFSVEPVGLARPSPTPSTGEAT